MTILLLPIFLFGLVISSIVYLGLQQANEQAVALRRVRVQDRAPLAGVPEKIPAARSRFR